MAYNTFVPTPKRMLQCADGNLCASMAPHQQASISAGYVNDLQASSYRFFTQVSIQQKSIRAQRSEAFASHEHNSLLILNGHSHFSEPEHTPTQNLNPIIRVGVWELRSLIS